jgi:F-type H+-transporting ATPase subunit gamma
MGQGKSREIRTKISSVKNTEKITRAMKLVSASKLRKATLEIEVFGPSFEGLLEILPRVASQGTHPYMEAPQSEKVCIVLYSGERSLCGAYNANAYKMAFKLEEECKQAGKQPLFVAIGRKGAEALRSAGKVVEREFNLIQTLPGTEYLEGITDYLTDLFIRGEVGSIVLVYTKFRSAASKTVVNHQLLPFKTEGVAVTEPMSSAVGDGLVRRHYILEPSRKEILEEMFSLYLVGKVRDAYIQSLASEYGSRMVAMDNASRNAGEMISALTLKLNRARQAAITQEIAEIVGGAAGLE